MISYIKGTMIFANEESIVVETGGIGYEIYVPTKHLNSFIKGQITELHTHYHLKEDGVQLFGFPNSNELKLFKLILSVSGIGPKGALAVLSTLGVDQFSHAVMSEDVKTITRVPGVGKKTAQRLVIELKDRLAKKVGLSQAAVSLDGSLSTAEGSLMGEALEALEALGYSSAEVMPVVNKVIDSSHDAGIESIIRQVLKQLAGH